MFDLLYLLIAFAGGVFGAAVGALPAFILCGVAAIVGGGVAMATGDASFSNLVAWGPLLGPHISFAGGVAAATYAARKGLLDSGKDIVTALMGLDAPDVLLVGGVFGALGYLLQWLFNLLPGIGDAPWTNTIALAIVVNALIARLVFGNTGIFGKVRKGDSRWIPTDVAAWLPYQSKPLQLIIIGLGVGLPAAYISSLFPASVGLVFGVSAVALVFLQFGTNVPVTHHIALSAELVAAATGSIWWAVAFAVAAAFFGELYAALFTYHGDNHVDPPSATLATTYILFPILGLLGVFNWPEVSGLIALVIVAGAGYMLLQSLQAPKQIPARRPTV